MDYLSRLIMIAENNGGIINNKIAAEHGVSRTILSKLCLDNKIQRIARGQYVFNDDMQDELLSISMRSNLFVFSHETALFLHCHLFIQFLPFFSYTNTETLYTITETLILSRKLPVSFRDNTASFRVCIRVLPASIDFCVIVWSFA